MLASPSDVGVPSYILRVLEESIKEGRLPTCKADQSKLWSATVCLPHVR